jgi:predicted house-cleaning NTP pyrophosphatase (Maf/HAM1 superfamily)
VYDHSADLDGLILEKPADEDEAFTMVKSLSGLTLFLYIR